jgi:hypothetical protein
MELQHILLLPLLKSGDDIVRETNTLLVQVPDVLRKTNNLSLQVTDLERKTKKFLLDIIFHHCIATRTTFSVETLLCESVGSAYIHHP